MPIHPNAVVDAAAEIDPSVDVGPFTVIQGPVCIRGGTRILSHAYITGSTEIGADCLIHSFTTIGDLPQDREFSGEKSYCRIGDRVVVREGVSIHRGTAPESTTIVGSGCLLMANSHVAHNCALGEDVVLANGAILAGHVQVGDRAFVSGNAAIHQFVRIGELAMLGGLAKVVMDIPPFFSVGREGTCVGTNVVGLRRAGFSAEERQEVHNSFRLLYRSGKGFRTAVGNLAESVVTTAGRRLVAFLLAPTQRGIASGRGPCGS
jgi:UDP-N-acetylglucosamine acyltransferase